MHYWGFQWCSGAPFADSLVICRAKLKMMKARNYRKGLTHSILGVCTKPVFNGD